MSLSPLPGITSRPYVALLRHLHVRRRIGAHRSGYEDYHHGHYHDHHRVHRHDADGASDQPKVEIRGVAINRTAHGPCGDMTLAGLACMSGTDSSERGTTAVLIGLARDLRRTRTARAR
jgi:hypothetical protein